MNMAMAWPMLNDVSRLMWDPPVLVVGLLDDAELRLVKLAGFVLLINEFAMLPAIRANPDVGGIAVVVEVLGLARNNQVF